MHRWKVICFCAYSMLISALLLGCDSGQTNSIRVGTNAWPGYEPGYLAEAKNLYGAAEIRMRQFSSATEVLRAFRNETIDVAALTLDETLLLAQDGLDVVIFLVADMSNGADVIVATPDVKNMAALAGKRIAVENTAVGAYVLARALGIHKIDPSTITTVPMTTDESINVFELKRAEAVVTFEPYRSALLEQGATQIFSSAEMPGEIVDVLVTRRSTIEANRDALRAFASGWLQAVKYITEWAGDSPELVAKRMGVEPQDVASLFEGLELPDVAMNRAMLAGDPPRLASIIDRIGPLLVEKSLLTVSHPGNHLVDGFALEDE